jgi:cell division inhibitor SepF
MGIMQKFMEFIGLSEEVEEEEETDELTRKRHAKTNNVVNLSAVKETGMKVVLVEPRSYDEVQEITDHLREKRCVVMNLQRIPIDQAKRIVDFLSGATYALNGEMQKVGVNIFICAPNNVDLQGTISEMFHQEMR